jgi:hypothetical protein
MILPFVILAALPLITLLVWCQSSKPATTLLYTAVLSGLLVQVTFLALSPFAFTLTACVCAQLFAYLFFEILARHSGRPKADLLHDNVAFNILYAPLLTIGALGTLFILPRTLAQLHVVL